MMQAQDFPLISHSPKRWAEFVKTRTPILESIIPLDARDLRAWRMLNDKFLIAHARWKVADEKCGGRKELQKADSGLHDALRRRKLLGEVGLQDRYRDWVGMGKEELVAHAKEFIAENGISGRKELAKADEGLYQALRRRKLLDGLGLPDTNVNNRLWAGMGKEELVDYSKTFIAERGISGRKGLKKAGSGLYQALRKRKLLDEVGLEDLRGERRDWTGLGKKELVGYSKKFIAERGINRRKELKKADAGLYQALWKRKLLDAVFRHAEAAKHLGAVEGVLDALESFGDSK